MKAQSAARQAEMQAAAQRVLDSFASDDEREPELRSSRRQSEVEEEAGESDFEYEVGEDGAPRPPVAERAQLLHRIAACTNAASLRAWASNAPDEDLTTLIQAVRELHSSWLHADAALINMNVELQLVKQGNLDAEADRRTQGDNKKQLIDRVTAAESDAAEASERLVALEAKLQQKDTEIGALTMALQQVRACCAAPRSRAALTV